MKRVGYLFEKLYDMDNLLLSEKMSIKPNTNKRQLKRYQENRQELLNKLQSDIKNHTLQLNGYKEVKIYEHKWRTISISPLYPDKIFQNALLNIIKPILSKSFISKIYSCIEGRGILKAHKDLCKYLRNKQETKYCLSLDIVHFYENIDNEILKQKLRDKIKDEEFLRSLNNYIDLSKGVVLGSSPSAYLANFYLSDFDHFVKEVLKVKYYQRYCDNIIILSDNKDYLRSIFFTIRDYLKINVHLDVKSNYQIFPIDDRGIDFIGYRFYHTHIKIRNRIKYKFKRLISRFKINKIPIEDYSKRVQAYFGWLKYCNSKNLFKFIEDKYNVHFSNFKGVKVLIRQNKGLTIKVLDVLKYSKYYKICFIFNHRDYFIKSTNSNLFKYIITKKTPFYLCL